MHAGSNHNRGSARAVQRVNHNVHLGGAWTHSRQSCIGAVRHGTLRKPMIARGPCNGNTPVPLFATCVCKALRNEPIGSQYVVTQQSLRVLFVICMAL